MNNESMQTIRQQIITLLENSPSTARDISQDVGISEKDVSYHLASIEKSVKNQNKKLHIDPYYCLSCGFQFKKRNSFKKPGKCPGCKDGRIAQAVFKIVSKSA
ncbi:Predicted HTH domain/Zn-ribbon transcriptional regulator [Desulfamplus magnetovallimortis]|uniref:Predicted HTH domain/Zn-ribbon transcriptional regulator n=1 Tax=Desulfamplus magnetovallimortis TaxID=1246637 RepID=A0A1W1HAY3_9BACT|nr:ArsR family transcriptional regulator [Desulfamplus magnetovallimortis]SLM29599.1 Predicted HTH domain/Zn-ribbon transcriptional regulator [Desulfamplus magnetovallimortis]